MFCQYDWAIESICGRIVAENAVEDRALLVRHVDGDAAERRRAGRGIGDGNRAAGRRPCAVSRRERIGVGDDGALAGVDRCGGRGGNEGRAGRLVDEAAAEFIFNQAEDDRSGAGNDGIGDHHGVGADRLDGVGVEGASHADAPARDLHHARLPDREARRQRKHHDGGESDPDRGHRGHRACHDLRRFGDPVDVDDGEVAEEEHGDRHDEAGDLSEQRSDHGCGGSGVGRGRSVDRKDALQHLPCPVVTRIEGRPTDVEG